MQTVERHPLWIIASERPGIEGGDDVVCGVVQPIGGVNVKIEGFFDVCKAKGLTGDQGVIIPASNVRHLMLRQDVVDAVSSNQFHIYPIESIDEGIELLTGIETAERGDDGVYPIE